MKVINAESRNQERDDEIYAAVVAGNTTLDVAKQFKVSVGNVRRIVRRAKTAEQFDLKVTDGLSTIPVAAIATSQGFKHACRFAMSRFSGTFSRLELPQWRFVAAGNEMLIKELVEEMA